MIILDSTVRNIKVTLTSVIGSQQQITAHYVDTTSSASTPGSSTTQTNSATPVTAVSAPAASTQRAIKMLTICDTQAGGSVQYVYTSVYYDDNGTTRYLWAGAIPCGGVLTYCDAVGWQVLDWRGHVQYSASPAFLSANPILIPSYRTNSASSSSGFLTNVTYMVYMGRATQDHTSANVLYEVTFSGSSRTTAYVSVLRGDPDPAGTVNAYSLGRTDVHAAWGSTGIKNTSVTLTGCKRGDHIWVGFMNNFSGATATLRCVQTIENSTSGIQYSLYQGASGQGAISGTTVNGTSVTNNPPLVAVQFNG